MTGSVAYLDSSAIVKLVVAEGESDALRAWTDDRQTVTSCALARTEVLRAVRRSDADIHARARSVLDGLDLIAIDDPILDAAATLHPDVLRSLDVIHLAAARAPGSWACPPNGRADQFLSEDRDFLRFDGVTVRRLPLDRR